MKVDFLLRNIETLEKSLSSLNIPLKLIRTERFDHVPPALLRVAKKHDCKALYFNKEYEVNERRRDAAVSQLFEENGRTVNAFTDQVILDVGQIRTKAGGWYTKFTPFKRKWLAILEEGGPPDTLARPRRQQPLGIESDHIPASLKGFQGIRRPDLWPAGESVALRRLKHFVTKRVAHYHEQRDRPAVDGTSQVSPYLACGVLSPKSCLEAAMAANAGKAFGGSDGVSTWISELIWREFYRHILMGFPRVSMGRAFRESTDDLPWRHDKRPFLAWCEGRTGIPIVDAAIRQLAETGWMHNRLRMIVAMFLSKDLFIDWRWGEAHFMRHLVDGDLANNNGGWQWSASTGTDSVPYFRVFNPFLQSRKFDPSGEFIRRHVPELASLNDDAVHQPDAAQARSVGYPQPIVDRTRTRERVVRAFRACGGS